MDNQMNNQIGMLLSSGIFFLFALVFLVSAEINKRITEKNKKLYQGKAQGEVLEIVKSGTQGIGGIGFNNRTYVIYKYTVGENTYIVKPLVLNSNAPINLKYANSAHTFCVTYFGAHSGSRQTNYRAGESITVAYLPETPSEHQIVDDKDKTFFYKGFRIAGFVIMSIAMILLIVSFLLKISRNTI